MIQCEEDGCEKEFETQRGASVHHTVKHKKSNKIKCKYECCGREKEKYPSELSYHYKKEIDNNTTEIKLPTCRECQKQGGEHAANWQGGKVKKECNNCGNLVKMWPCRSKRMQGFFCGQCKSEWYSKYFRGENHPRYKENTIKETSYYGDDWLEMRERVRDRDDNICQECGKNEKEIGRKPSVHHIMPVKAFKKNNYANYMNNLIQLCPSCHHKNEKNLSVIEQLRKFSKDYLIITGKKND